MTDLPPERTPLPIWRRALVAVLAVWLAALAPILVAEMLIGSTWTHREPPWAWLLVPPLPLIGLAMASSRSSAMVWCWFAALGAFVAFGAFAALRLEIWPTVASTLFAVALLTLTATIPAAFKARTPGLFGRALLVWTGGVLGLGILAAYGEEFIVARKAELHADGRPYCIEYASQTDGFGYEPAKTLFDLNGLKMRARLLEGGSTMFRLQNHALLMVETGEGRAEWTSWSYTAQDFVFGNGVVKASCAPAAHYVRALPFW